MHPYDKSSKKAAAILRFRRRRAQLLPRELFAEPAWDLLLELFVADASGRSITGGEVCHRIGAAPTVMSRWLIHLHKLQFVLGDGSGNLDDALVISASGLDRIEVLLRETTQLPEQPHGS